MSTMRSSSRTFCRFSINICFADNLSAAMGYENDAYVDDDREPLMHQDMPSQPEPQNVNDNYMNDEGWPRRDRSPTPVMSSMVDDKGRKTRKRSVKKTGRESSHDGIGFPAQDLDEDGFDDRNDKEPCSNKKRKITLSRGGGKGRNQKKVKGKAASSKEEGLPVTGSKSKWSSKEYGGGSRDQEADAEVAEMWNIIVGTDSEGEEYKDDEIEQLFSRGKKKKQHEKTPAEISFIIEHVLAELEVAAEEDAALNRQNKPAVNKLKKLPLLIDALSKKKLQQEFLDHGVLTLLKNWLEPLPDGSLPNMTMRSAILKLLADFPIDLKQYDRREQMKKSGLGKVIIFLSKSVEETAANRKLAKELVDEWSRPIFNTIARYEDMGNNEDDRAPFRIPSSHKQVAKAPGLLPLQDDLLDLTEIRQMQKSGNLVARQRAVRPEPMAFDFVVRPHSKVDPKQVMTGARQVVVTDPRRSRILKKLQQSKYLKRRSLQALKVSAQGRGLLTCI